MSNDHPPQRSGHGHEQAQEGIFDLRRFYEKEYGCNIDMRTGCHSHRECVRGARVELLWRLTNAA